MSLLPEHGKMMDVCSESGEQERGLYDHACCLLNFPRLLGRAFTPSAGVLLATSCLSFGTHAQGTLSSPANGS